MPTLKIKLPNQMEMTHQLSGELITIGRRPDNTIQIVDRAVSGHHVELIATDGHYRLHDLGSTNLTFVDGEPVTDFHLHQACKIAFGTVECVYDPMAAAAVTFAVLAQWRPPCRVQVHGCLQLVALLMQRWPLELHSCSAVSACHCSA